MRPPFAYLLSRRFRIFRFSATGAVSFFADLIAFQLVLYFTENLALAFVIAGLVGTVVSFLLSNRVVFLESREDPLLGRIFRFMAVVGFVSILNFLVGIAVGQSFQEIGNSTSIAVRIMILFSLFFVKYLFLVLVRFR